MKIVHNDIPAITIEEFAEEHDLTLVISERSFCYYDRYYCYFEDSAVKTSSGGLLLENGNGMTKDEAIRDYAWLISNRTLVLRACHDDREDIMVPSLVYHGGDNE